MSPRQEIKKLNELNSNEGFYGTYSQFAILIETRLYQEATKIMNSMNDGFMWSNEREIHNTIYNYLLDGISVKEIKNRIKN